MTQERARDRWLFFALGAAGLAVSTVFHLAGGAGAATGTAAAPAPAVLALAVLALAWLALPVRPAGDRRWPAVAFFAGLLAIATVLVLVSPAFFGFSWIGYLYAFTLFGSPWILPGVTANALAQYTTLLAVGVPSEVMVYLLPLGAFAPVAVAGWITAVEQRRARRAKRRARRGQPPPGGRAGRERGPAGTAGRPGTGGGAPGRAAAAGPRHPRHPGPGPDRDRHPRPRGRARGRRPATARLPPGPGRVTGDRQPERGPPLRAGPASRAADRLPAPELSSSPLASGAERPPSAGNGAIAASLRLAWRLAARSVSRRLETGFARDRSGCGPRGLRQRLDEVGGTLVVESAAGEGTAVSVSVPEPAAEDGP
nr:hypothetical protein GCM10010200_019540 [Actinomadura rugatobispora]